MNTKKCLRNSLALLVRALVYLVLGLPTVGCYCFQRFRLTLQIRRLSSSCIEQNTEGSRRVVIKPSDVLAYTGLENLDFKLQRSKAYIHQNTFGRLEEIVQLFCFRQRVPLVPNYLLRHALLNSFFSNGLSAEKNTDSDVQWRFSFQKFARYTVLKEFAFDVTDVFILKSGGLRIRDRTGKFHTPYCKTWPLAKAHVQVQLTLMSPLFVQNVDQMILSCAIADEIRANLPETSTLRRLLEPHTRFTRVVNVQLLKELSSTKSASVLEQFPCSWMTEYGCVQEGAVRSIVPDFKDDIHYQYILKRYFTIFREFIIDLSPHITKDFEILCKAITQYLPGVRSDDMVDVLAVFLWNSSVVHSSDRVTYLNKWARQFGCMSVSKPLVEPEEKDHKVNVNTISSRMTYSTISTESLNSMSSSVGGDCVINMESRQFSSEDGLQLFPAMGVFRTKCFLRNQVQYNPTKNCDDCLFTTKYDFNNTEATAAAENFLAALKCESKIIRQRAEEIVRDIDIKRSVCF